METLGERQALILRAIVREFTRSGEAIGSKHIVDAARLGVSAATVRNEMARLEEMGYLQQPHTSAGRVPTDQAYRFIVDEIKQPKPLTDGQRRAMTDELLTDDALSIEELIRRAGETLGKFTRHAAAVIARRSRSSVLRRLELISVASTAVMIVAIAENGRVEQRVVPTDADISAAELDALCERLNADLHGLEIEWCMRALDERSAGASGPIATVLHASAETLGGLLGAEEHIVVSGVANLAGGDDIQREDLQRVYETLERQTAVLEMLASAYNENVTVRIGSELGREGLRSVSVVVAPFGNDSAAGSIGVIGPTRMDYGRVISTAHSMAGVLEKILGSR